MPVCEEHGIYYTEDQFCGPCWRNGVPTQSYAKKDIKVKKIEKVTNKTSALNNARQKAQVQFSQFMRTKWDNNGFCKCSTCGKVKETFGGRFGIHCGHWFPKSKYYWIEFEEANCGPQCYDCNINHKEGIPKMRNWLVERFSESEILRIERLADARPKGKNDNEAQILFYKSVYKLFKAKNNVRTN